MMGVGGQWKDMYKAMYSSSVMLPLVQSDGTVFFWTLGRTVDHKSTKASLFHWAPSFVCATF